MVILSQTKVLLEDEEVLLCQASEEVIPALKKLA